MVKPTAEHCCSPTYMKTKINQDLETTAYEKDY